MEVLLGIVCVLIWASFSLLHTSLTTNTNFCPALTFHFLQAVAARSDKQTEEINLWKFFDGDVDFVRWPLGALLLVILHRWSEVGVVFHGTVDKFDTLVFELLAVTNFTSVSPSTVCIVRRRWGGRPEEYAKYMRKCYGNYGN